jgi:hypothetical protein
MKEIDWTKVKSGDRFTARIEGVICSGKIRKNNNGRLHLCQNKKDGDGILDKHGYKYSWSILEGTLDQLRYTWINVTNLKIISQNKTKPMAKKKAPKKKSSVTEKIKTLTGANWHIAQEKKGFSTKLVAKNGKVNRYDKGFNNRQNAMTNITSSVRNGFIDDGIFIEAMIAAKTREDVVAAISAYGYLKGKVAGKVASPKSAKKTAKKKSAPKKKSS